MDYEQALRDMGLDVKAVHVPLGYMEKEFSLWWTVTLLYNGRDVAKSPYMAGMGHCPGYNTKAPASWNQNPQKWPVAVAWAESTSGFAMTYALEQFKFKRDLKNNRIPLLPKMADVISCLVRDSDVLLYKDFESWADEYGYDSDSRKAESTYQACLKTALALQSGLGAAKLEELRELFQDY